MGDMFGLEACYTRTIAVVHMLYLDLRRGCLDIVFSTKRFLTTSHRYGSLPNC